MQTKYVEDQIIQSLKQFLQYVVRCLSLRNTIYMFELNILLEIIIEVENNNEKDFSVPFSEAEKP